MAKDNNLHIAKNEVLSNLELIARNLKLYYWDMLGYPGESNAINLINNFCHFHKFDFGRWKGHCIGEIMMIYPKYIKWCIDNVNTFKLNKEEEALFNTSWKHSIGGYKWDVIYGQVESVPAENPDYNIIELMLTSLQ